MKCDERGNLYCTGPGGVWAIAPDGEHLGTIETPEAASNMCFGGSDWRTLYITASRSVYRVPHEGARARRFRTRSSEGDRSLGELALDALDDLLDRRRPPRPSSGAAPARSGRRRGRRARRRAATGASICALPP